MRCPNCGGEMDHDVCPYCDTKYSTQNETSENYDFSKPVTDTVSSKSPQSEAYQLEKWYRKTWVIILFLIFFFPVGLFLLWRYKEWSIITKIVITVCVILIAIYGFFMTEETPAQNTYESGLNTEITMVETDFSAGKALRVFETSIQF